MLIPMLDIINCSEERFWSLYGDDAWLRGMLLEGLGYGGIVIDSNVVTPTGWEREFRMTPKLRAPDAVLKLVGGMSITDTGRFNRATRTLEFRQRLSVMSDKLLISGTMRTEADGVGRCRRISKVNFEAKVFGLGGLIEKAAESNVRKGFQDGADYVNRWLAAHPEAQQTRA